MEYYLKPKSSGELVIECLTLFITDVEETHIEQENGNAHCQRLDLTDGW